VIFRLKEKWQLNAGLELLKEPEKQPLRFSTLYHTLLTGRVESKVLKKEALVNVLALLEN
jgi:hypothetical protein